MTDICYIIGAGEFHGTISPKENDLVIAADGGYDTLRRIGARADILLGDLDSLKGEISDISVLRFPKEKDETDMHLAYLEGARRGYRVFHIYGGTGGREDHTFANYSLLLQAKLDGNDMRLFGCGSEIFVICDEENKISGAPGETISVFAFGGAAEGVSIKGLKYEIENTDLYPSFPIGVSNEFISSECSVSVRRGALLIMKEKK